MSELVKASDFGLDEQKADKISEAFAPLIAEKKGLSKVYELLINKELCPETYKEAAALRNKLTKVGTGIDKVHKTQKAFALSYGRFVDAWKNKEKEPIQQMKDKLMEIVKHEEIQAEKARLVLQGKRESELIDYVECFPAGLGEMEEGIYQTLKKGIIQEYEENKELERQAEEDRKLAEKARKEEEERKNKEIERLKKEAEAAEKKRLEEEKKRLVEKARELAKQALETLKIEEKARIEREKQEAILKKEREAKEKLEAELKAKEEAEAKLEAEKAEKLKAEAEAKRKAELAPEKDKVSAWIESFEIEGLTIKGFSEESVIICHNINEKFKSFKLWAQKQKDLIK